MERISDGWGRVDGDIKRHFAALQQRMVELGMSQSWPSREIGGELLSVTETPQQSRPAQPEPSASPKAGLKLPTPMTPVGVSETPETSSQPPLPAPIAARRSSVSDDVCAREEDPRRQEENTPKENWRRIRMTRITSFRNRLVGSLSVEELKHLGANWMARVRDTPRILLTGDDLALYRALEEALIYHGLESPASRSKGKEDTPVLKQESPSASPQASVKLPRPMDPLQSRTAQIPIAPLRPAPIEKRSVSQPVATEAPPPEQQVHESSDDRRDETHEATPVVEHVVGEQNEKLLRKEKPGEAASEEAERFERRPLEEIISRFGISGVHPAAVLVPMSTDEEFQVGCRDVKAHGFLHAVKVTDENLLLDGRNRLQIGAAIGFDPPIERFNPSDPIAYVLSENVVRRHLSAGQRAMIAERIANLGHGGNRRTDEFKMGNPILKTRDEAARLAGSTPEAITQARSIRQWATSEEVKAVEAGTESLAQAYKRAKKKRQSEGESAPKRKRKSKLGIRAAESETSSENSGATQSEAPTASCDVAVATAASELPTLEQRANTLFSWMQEVHEKPDEYDGATFASLAPENIGESLEAVRQFYGVFFKHFHERFPSK
jgi:hypothetical protein